VPALSNCTPIWGNTPMKKARTSSRAGGPTGAGATVATVIVTTMRRTLALT
jgi:hypothetical protein